MDKSDFERPIVRLIVRELLASCVFKPLMGYFTPYQVNKVSPLLTAALKGSWF